MLERKPRQLSGGQRQRVAMGRAIVRQPKVFLFDEPLSNLDAKLRIAMRVEIRKLQRRLNTTSIYVTHDQLEAMTLADILVVMNGGQVEQIGNPLDIYKKPATTFVATFIGAPPMNLMPARSASLNIPGGADGVIGIRPEDLEIANDGTPEGAMPFELTVAAIEHVGAETYVYGMRPQQGDADTISAKPGEAPPGEMLVRVPGQDAPAIGEKIRVLAPAKGCMCSSRAAANGLKCRLVRLFRRFPGCLNTTRLVPILLCKGCRKGPETSKSLREGFVNYVSCSFALQSVPAGFRRDRARARPRRQRRRRLPSLQYREV